MNRPHPIIPTFTALMAILIALAGMFVAAGRAGTYTFPPVVQSDGNIVGVTVNITVPATSQPTTQPTTQPVTPPVVVVPPVIVPPIVSPPVVTPTTQPTSAAWPNFQPVWNAAEQVAVYIYYNLLPKNVAGNVDLGVYISRIPAAQRIYWAEAGDKCTQAGDIPDFKTAQNAAKANGSIAVLLREGNTYHVASCNDNITMSGSLAHPAIVAGVGPGGYDDNSLPAPHIIGGRLCWAGNNVHCGMMGNLKFDGGNANKTQGSAIGFVDGSSALATAASSDMGWFNIEVTGYQRGLEVQAVGGHFDTAYIVNRCTIHDNIGGPDDAGLYGFAVNGLYILDDFFVGNGQKNGLGTAHDIYYNGVYTDTSDAQVCIVNTWLATAAACGAEVNRHFRGRYIAALANPVQFYGGGGGTCWMDYCIADGGGDEFDTTKITFASQTGVTQAPGSTLSKTGTPAGALGQGPRSDCATTAYASHVWILNKGGKTGAINSDYGFGCFSYDVGKHGLGMPNVATTMTADHIAIDPNYVMSAGHAGIEQTINGPPNTLPVATINQSNCYLGVGPIPAWFHPERTVSAYAKTLTASHPTVVDGPTLADALRHMNDNPSQWPSEFEAVNYVQWAQETP